MRVERCRIGPMEALEEVTRKRGRRSWQTVRTVNVQPKAQWFTYICNCIDGVDGAGESCTSRGHNRYGMKSCGEISAEHFGQDLRSHPTIRVNGNRVHTGTTDPQEFGSSFNARVRLLTAVHDRAYVSESVDAAIG
jgi:hypothetical protein